MRFCLVVALALLMPANFPAGGDQKKKEVNSHIRLKENGTNTGPKNGKGRVFHAEFEIGVEQKTDAGVIINGVSLYGRAVQRIASNFDIPDGKSVTYEGFEINGGLDQERQHGDYSYTIKVESVDNTRLRLHVSTKDLRTYGLKDGFTRSWNLQLQAAKAVKLGEKVKLELTDESLIGIKSTFEGVIEEIVKD
jgi:hypothetical protein